MWNFKGNLWNSTQNIIPIHWMIRFLYKIEILRALRFKSPYSFFKCPLIPHTVLNYCEPHLYQGVSEWLNLAAFLERQTRPHVHLYQGQHWGYVLHGYLWYIIIHMQTGCGVQSLNAGNYANPVYVVATICHQVCWLHWGHLSLFHTTTSLLIWYKMFSYVIQPRLF